MKENHGCSDHQYSFQQFESRQRAWALPALREPPPPREPRQSASRGSWRLGRAHHRLQQVIAVLCSPGRAACSTAGWRIAGLPLLFTSPNAPPKRDVLGTLLYAVQRWYRIRSEALRKYLRGRQLIPPARLQPG